MLHIANYPPLLTAFPLKSQENSLAQQLVVEFEPLAGHGWPSLDRLLYRSGRIQASDRRWRTQVVAASVI